MLEFQITINKNIQRCYNLAIEPIMDEEYGNKNFIISIYRQIETDKIRISIRKLIRRKYITAYLKTKYGITPNRVYLRERRNTLKRSLIYLSKTANGLN